MFSISIFFVSLIKKIISFNGLGGNYGVVFFFILSGFLITYLLFIENEKKGIHLLKFYLRRFFRIWPLYYFTLFIGFLVFPFVLFCLNSPYSESAHLSYYLCFATNFEHIYYSEPENGILGVQWSVAIEEQFYLFWPLLFLIMKKIRLFIVFILIYLISDFFYILQENESIKYYHSLSNIRFLAFGGIIAYLALYFNSSILKILNKLPKKLNFLVYLISLIALFYSHEISSLNKITLGIMHFFPTFFFSFVILDQIYSKQSFLKFGTIKIFEKLGRISYGIYLLHMIVIFIVNSMIPNNNLLIFILKVIITLVLTIICSSISYSYFEKPFLKIKERFNN